MSRKVKFRTITNQNFEVEVSDDESVSDVKTKIEKEQGDKLGCQANALTLIHSGKVMENDKQIKEYKITEKSFIIVVSVNKPEEKPKPEASRPPQVPNEPPVTAPSVPAAQPPSEPTSAIEPPAATGTDLGDNLTGAPDTAMVQEITNMGFPRDMVLQALRVSFNNPDRAVEFLLSGSLPEETAPLPTTAQEAVHPVPPGDASSNVPIEGPIAQLANSRQFQMLRQAVQNNPETLQHLLSQISIQNPELFNLIQENDQAFYQFLNENPDTGESETNPTSGQQQEIRIPLTASDREAVDRLMALGFSEINAAQAYFACEKNEELAANILLNDPDDA